MPYRVALLPSQPINRKRGGVLWRPGEGHIYENHEDIPELVRMDNELRPGEWWSIDELTEDEAKAATAPPEPPKPRKKPKPRPRAGGNEGPLAGID